MSDNIKFKRINNIQLKPPPIVVQVQKYFRVPQNDLFDCDFPNIAIFGKRESGKTNLILNILDSICNDNTIIIVFCGTVDVSDMWKFICDKYRDRMVKYNSIVETDKKTNKPVNNLEAFIDRMKNKKRTKENNNYVVIFDDISDELRNKYLPVLYKESRHFNSYTITSSQAIKDILPGAIQNLNICILMGGIPDESLAHIHKNMRLLIPFEDFKKLYHECTLVPYNFMFIDCNKEVYRKNFDLEADINNENNIESEEESEKENE